MIKVKLKEVAELDFKTNESYKALRTNIQFCGNDVKVIGVTSCVPNEGKSSVCMNLAISMAESGKRVLLIDADLRKSVLLGRYKIRENVKGLSHFLSGQAGSEEILCDTDVKNLHVIFAGQVPPNPAELLGKRYFKETLAVLRELYDYIIIDNAPLGRVIDAAIVAQECDGMVMVIAANNTSYKMAQRVSEQLQKTGCTLLGAVLNKVDTSKNNGYYGQYYGGYYGSYGDYE